MAENWARLVKGVPGGINKIELEPVGAPREVR